MLVDHLKAHYHQVVFATGAQTDRRLNIPGIDYQGSHPATDFVAWYNGHPDFRDCLFDLSQERAAVTLATGTLDDPTGFGRIVRDEYGNFQAIVEHNDCTAEQLHIKEINPSYYCFNSPKLFEALDQVRPDNKKQEYYLTDTLGLPTACIGVLYLGCKVHAPDENIRLANFIIGTKHIAAVMERMASR